MTAVSRSAATRHARTAHLLARSDALSRPQQRALPQTDERTSPWASPNAPRSSGAKVYYGLYLGIVVIHRLSDRLCYRCKYMRLGAIDLRGAGAHCL